MSMNNQYLGEVTSRRKTEEHLREQITQLKEDAKHDQRPIKRLQREVNAMELDAK